MVAGLLGSKPADRGEDAESVASQHDDVGRLTINDARNLGIWNVLDRVGATGVFSDANVIVVRNTREGVVDDVFEDATIFDSVENIGFLLSREVDALGIASTLDVEDTGI